MFNIKKLYRRYVKGKISKTTSINYHAIVLVNNGDRVKKYLLKLSWLKQLRYDSREVVIKELVDCLNKEYKVKREDILFVAYIDPWQE